jgi:membrane-associated phospholipid phosphatase
MLLSDRPRVWSPLWVVPLLIAGGFAALPFDVRLSRQFDRSFEFNSEIGNLLRLSEIFAHGMGAAMVIVTAWVIDRRHRRELVRIGVASLGAGLVANLGKLCLSRERPDSYKGSGDGWGTFIEWFPGLGVRSDFQSFPSAHAATAIGLAMGLSWLYPHGRWLFYFFAFLAVTQRIVSQNHYLSDALWGAAIGYVVAWCCLYGPVLARLFARLERRPNSMRAC